MQSFLYQTENTFCESCTFCFHTLGAPNQWFYSIEPLYFLLMAVLVNIVVSYAFEKCSALHQQGKHIQLIVI